MRAARSQASPSSLPGLATGCLTTWLSCLRPRTGDRRRLLGLAEDHARSLDLREIHLYTNEAMTKNLAYYGRHGYVESHRAEQHGFHRVFFRKPID